MLIAALLDELQDEYTMCLRMVNPAFTIGAYLCYIAEYTISLVRHNILFCLLDITDNAFVL